MREVIEDQFGIALVFERLVTPRVAALTVKDARRRSCAIIVNASSRRSRISAYLSVELAHELAHALFDNPTAPFRMWIDSDGDDRDDSDQNDPTLDATERRARAFAAELLAPDLALRRLFGPPRETTSTEQAVTMGLTAQNELGLTPELTANHLRNRGFIAEELRTWLSGELPRPTDLPAERVPSFVGLVSEALERGVVSGMRARELLGVTAWDDLPWLPSDVV